MFDPCTDAYGWMAALVAILSFGTFGVPMKGEASTACDVDALVFQTYKSTMCFLSSFLVLLLGIDLSFTPWGLVSGFFWVPAGTAGIFAVRKAGLAISVGIWSSVIVFLSFFWGIFVFHEEVKDIKGACSAATVLVVGIWGMSVFSQGQSSEPASFDTLKYNITPYDTEGSQSSDSLSDYEENISIKTSPQTIYGSIEGGSPNFEKRYLLFYDFYDISSRKLGIAGAVFNGLWAGTMMVPLHFAGSNSKGLHFVISFGSGAMVVTVLMWCIRLTYHYKYCRNMSLAVAKLPSFHLQKMLLPGCIAGLLWSLGNMCSIISVSILGQGIGYSVVQSAMLVSGLWGIFYYKEIRGSRNIVGWFFSAIITLCGILWLSYEHVPVKQ